MKFDELRKITPETKVVPIIEGEVADDVNEAFEALGNGAFTPLIVTDETTIFKRCVQCSYFSIVSHCPRCDNHPIMLPVDFMRLGQQMETVGRVCCHFARTTCIEKIGEKSKWCGDCVAFWEREFNPPQKRRVIQLPDCFKAEPKQKVVTVSELEELEELGEEGIKEMLEETLDQLDESCSLLVQVKHLLDFLSDRGFSTVIEPQDRKEMQEFSTLIQEFVENDCGFKLEDFKADDEEVEDPSTAFNERDKDLLDRMANHPKMID
jgi:hypothetical protein